MNRRPGVDVMVRRMTLDRKRDPDAEISTNNGMELVMGTNRAVGIFVCCKCGGSVGRIWGS